MMRFVGICLYAVIMLFGNDVVGQSEKRPKYAPFSDKHKNKTDEMGQKQGSWKFYSQMSEIIYECDFVNDKKHGMSKRYYGYNKLMEELEYFNGKKDGTFRKYYFSGQVSVEGQYERGKRVGKWTYYHDDGSVKMEGEYKVGLMEGPWKTYDKKGNVRSVRTYIKGVNYEEVQRRNALKAAKEAALKKAANPAGRAPASTPAKPNK